MDQCQGGCLRPLWLKVYVRVKTRVHGSGVRGPDSTLPSRSCIDSRCAAPLPAMAAMTDETFKAMTAAIAQSVVQAITTLNMKTNKIDQKAIGGPPTWDSSKEDGFLEWKLRPGW